MRFGTIAAAVLLTTAGAALADPVATSLPYPGNPDWSEVVFDGTSMTTNGTATTMTTAQGRGIWFGWANYVGDQPSWTPGSASAGNYLSFTASVSANAADWHAYLYDNSGYAQITLNPTFCTSGNCYDTPAQQGVAFSFGGAGNVYHTTFMALDTTAAHTYEFLLKDNVVSYRVDGAGVYGAAYQTSAGAPVLVIGDSSGGTPTGVGSMTVSAMSFDNAPGMAVLGNVTPVPEPGEWAMIALGLAVVGFAGRRRS